MAFRSVAASLALAGAGVLLAAAGPSARAQSPAPGQAQAPAPAQTQAQTQAPVAGEGGQAKWYLQTSVFTKHFHPDPRHDNTQRLLNLEYWRPDSWLYGFASFDNSFGQRSIYAYVGKTWQPFDSSPQTYVKLTGGLLRGYSGEYRDKIPFNHSGIAPAIIPSIGYRFGRFSTELVLFGAAGVMINIGAFF